MEVVYILFIIYSVITVPFIALLAYGMSKTPNEARAPLLRHPVLIGFSMLLLALFWPVLLVLFVVEKGLGIGERSGR